TAMWSSFQPCNVAYQFRAGDGLAYDPILSQFADVDSLYKFMAMQGSAAISCANQLLQLFLAVKEGQTLGQPLSLRFAISSNYPLNPPEKEYTKGELESFLTKVHAPARDVLVRSWRPEWGSQATLFALLASPSQTISGVRSRIDELEQTRTAQTPY